MSRYYYDLHIHSCLSPCGDNESTPHNIAGMATLGGLGLVALTDHNTCQNCPAFFAAAKMHGIVPVAGMELTTAEEIHMVCLFPTLDTAMAFDKEIAARRILVPNREDIFGEQLVIDEAETIVAKEPHLLSNATTVTLEESLPLARKFGGVCYPAHIDREANGICAVLGSLPPDIPFTCVELHNGEREQEFLPQLPKGCRVVTSSDAHVLWDIREADAFLEIEDEPYSSQLVRDKLMRMLGGAT